MFGLTDRKVPVVEKVGGREISDRPVGSTVGPSVDSEYNERHFDTRFIG